MRTRFRKPVSHATLLNHFEWASARNHGREMRKVREENEALKLTLKIKQVMGILLLLPCLLFAQVPTPIPASAELRALIKLRQLRDDYATPGTVTTVMVTQTVTTVYELDYLRFIRAKASPTNINLITMKTNWLVLGTNEVSVVTNTSPVKPE